jgi:hypothetical protein
MNDIESYNELKQSLDMLRLVAMGKKQIEEGKTKPAEEAFEAIEKKLRI